MTPTPAHVGGIDDESAGDFHDRGPNRHGHVGATVAWYATLWVGLFLALVAFCAWVASGRHWQNSGGYLREVLRFARSFGALTPPLIIPCSLLGLVSAALLSSQLRARDAATWGMGIAIFGLLLVARLGGS